MNRILVTGGAGFIGSRLIRRLLEDRTNQVTCIDNLDSFYDIRIKLNNINPFLKNGRFEFICEDILNLDRMSQSLKGDFDIIIHLAAKAGVRPSIQYPVLYQKVNVIGTQNLLEIARQKGVKTFIFGSSSSVYGINPNVPWKEDEKLLPISPYASSKLAAEQIGHVYHHLYGIRFIALRFFTVYGPGQRPDLAIHKFARLISEGKPITMYGDGSSKRDYTYIEDIVDGVFASLEYQAKDFDIINLGNSNQVELRYLIELLQETMGRKAKVIQLPNQAGDVPQTYADISKAKAMLNYQPQTKIETGISAFIDWFNLHNQKTWATTTPH